MNHLRLPFTLPAGLLLGWQLFAAVALAQWSTDPGVNNAIITAAGEQGGARITGDGSGGAIIAWEDTRDIATNETDIYAQRINASGDIQWAAGGVAICTDPGLQGWLRITTDGSGGAIIVWQDNRIFPMPAIYAQRIDANGAVRWATNGVSLGGDSIGQSQEQLISDGAGGAIVTWKSSTGYFSNIRAQRINADGAIQWPVAGVTVSTSLMPEVPQIVSDGGGGAIIAWNEWVGIYPAGSHDIYAQRIDASGALQWGVGTAVCSATREQTAAQLTSDGSNGAIIVWQDTRSGTTSNLYAQRVNSAGAVQWAPDGVAVAPSAFYEVEHRVLSDALGGAYITWRQNNSSIHAQRVNAAGAIGWAASGVSISSTNMAIGPQIATDGGTGAIISFYRLGGPTADVFAQKIDTAGAIQWPLNGAVISNADGDQSSQQMIGDGSGGAIVVWGDSRNNAVSASDIYAQQVDAGGTPGGVTAVNEDDHSLPAAFTLGQNYPNPFNPSTTIQFSVPRSSHVTLTVFNLFGQEITTLVRKELGIGTYTLQWDASAYSSGTYVCRLQAGSYVETKKLVLLK
jgi:hypothetical protein